jgi:hypothetical protein
MDAKRQYTGGRTFEVMPRLRKSLFGSYFGTSWFCSFALLVLVTLTSVGCGGPDSKWDRKAIHGKVIGGEGRNGTVAFTPVDASIGPAALNDFQDGAYQFTAENGPVPGEYSVLVELEVDPAVAKAKRARPGERMSRNPADVGRSTFEEAAPIQITVSADGPLEIDLNVAQ